MSLENIQVTSHVGRDMLQSAALFRHPHQVVWEYVSNSLQYVDPGVQPRVAVMIEASPRRITIKDNGRGMSRSDLQRFFTMHAENEERRSGNAGRGYFGTGKSAAFAIADLLRITTVRDGTRSIVELRRSDLEAQASGAPVPVREIEFDQPTTEPNGTIVEIEQVRNIKIDRSDIIRNLERHIRFSHAGEVTVNGQTVEPETPPSEDKRQSVAKSTDHPDLEGCILILNVAKRPLREDEQGIAIVSNDVWLETTLAGAERKEMSNYIFGEMSVPALYAIDGIAPFDMSRSGKLNPENELVLCIYSFIGRHVEELRRELVDAEKNRREQADAAKLQKQADQIADIINQDYADFRKRFSPANSRTTGGGDQQATQAPSESGEPTFVSDGPDPAVQVGEIPRPFSEQPRTEPIGPSTQVDPIVEPAPIQDADRSGRIENVEASRKRTTGGFNVTYRNQGSETPRAFYERETRTIYINLDHPQVAAAKGTANNDDPNFRRLSFEIAFTEYAIGLAQEQAGIGWYLPNDHIAPLTDMRSCIDRVSRKAAFLFSADSEIS